MPNKRVWLENRREDGREYADYTADSGNTGEVELHSAAGFVSSLDGESLMISVNGSANNAVALAPSADRAAPPGTTVVYFGNTSVTLSANSAIIQVSGAVLKLTETALTVNRDINVTGSVVATGDVKAGTVSLKTHKHIGVQPGGGVSGLPV